jgi:hypothetical protein
MMIQMMLDMGTLLGRPCERVPGAIVIL